MPHFFAKLEPEFWNDDLTHALEGAGVQVALDLPYVDVEVDADDLEQAVVLIKRVVQPLGLSGSLRRYALLPRQH